jgi:hypothetical protein
MASTAGATAPNNELLGGYGTSSAPASGNNYGVQPVAGTTGFATGPYSTGGAAGASLPETQQGFYRTATPPAGPAAAAADTRAGYPSPISPGYGSSMPSTDYAGTPSYGSVSRGGETPAGSGNFAPVTTPDMGYGAAGAYPSTDGPYASYGSPNPYADSPPSAAFPPSTPPSYPSTDAGMNPAGTYSSYGTPYAAPPEASASTPYPMGPAGYGNPAPAYTASSQYGGYTDSPQYPSSADAAGSTTATSAAPAGTAGEYRPGSTSRNSMLLNPTAPAAPAGGTVYPGTYYSR